MDIISLEQVSKTFKGKHAVQNVTTTIKQGSIVAILGPNGAGKTTTISMMLGLLQCSEGKVRVFNQNPKNKEVREKIGVMLQEVTVLEGLKVGELIDVFRSYYPNPLNKKDLIQLAGLEQEIKMPAEKLSGGQKRRLSFALAMAGDPELLFLDEPTVGMDITSRRKFWETIRALTASGKTIVFTTHYLQEADEIADRIILFHRGSIVADGPPAQIKSALSHQVVSFVPEGENKELALNTIQQLPEIKQVYFKGSRIYVVTDQTDAVLTAIFKNNVAVSGIQIDQGKLDEAFEQLTMENEVSAS